MKKMMLMVVIAALATLTGCATTTAPRPQVVSPPPPPVAPMDPSMAQQYGPGPVSSVPPARPETMWGPPQNWAWMHSPPVGCDSGPHSVMIANNTRYHLRVVLDGQDLMVRGAYGVLPTFPPGTRVYICQAHLNQHTLSGVAFSIHYGQLQEIPGEYGRFDFHGTLMENTQPNGSKEFYIDQVTLNLM